MSIDAAKTGIVIRNHRFPGAQVDFDGVGIRSTDTHDHSLLQQLIPFLKGGIKGSPSESMVRIKIEVDPFGNSGNIIPPLREVTPDIHPGEACDLPIGPGVGFPLFINGRPDFKGMGQEPDPTPAVHTVNHFLGVIIVTGYLLFYIYSQVVIAFSIEFTSDYDQDLSMVTLFRSPPQVMVIGDDDKVKACSLRGPGNFRYAPGPIRIPGMDMYVSRTVIHPTHRTLCEILLYTYVFSMPRSSIIAWVKPYN